MVMKLITDEGQKFNQSIKAMSKSVSDLTIPLNQIKKQWYQGNKSIFKLKGPGKYDLLSLSYANKKNNELDFIYPLLRAKNKNIEAAITSEDDKHAYSHIEKKSIELGVKKSTEFPYAFAIHYGIPSKNIPARPYVLLGVEQVATTDIKKKPKIYFEIIKDYVLQVANQKKPSGEA